MSRISNALDRFVAFASRPRFRIGASVFRILAGLAILYEALINYHQRQYLFGPNGLWPWDYFVEGGLHYSIYAWSRSPLYFEICFHLGIVVATLWTIGWRTRWLTPINYVFWWSLHQRFPLLWDGGDNVLQLVLLYAIFADVGACFSVDAERRRRTAGRHPRWAQAAAMCHSASMLAFAIQIALVYGVAGLSKVQGETWRNGTSLYYALRGGEFTWPGYSEHIFHNSVLLTILAYATVAFQVSFPFFLFANRVTRTLVLVGGLAFHLGIALFMGLISFATILIAVDLSLIADAEYRALGSFASRRLARVQSLMAAMVARKRGTRRAADPT